MSAGCSRSFHARAGGRGRRRRVRGTVAALALVSAAGIHPRPALARQEEPAPARLVAFINEPREPELGEVFELRVTLRVAPGFVAYVPDTLLPAAATASAGAGIWTVESGPADSIDVHATYPVLPLLSGGVELPSVELLVRPARPGEEAGPRPVAQIAEEGEEDAALEHLPIYLGGVLAMPFQELVQADNAVPRPPADVLGGEWGAWLGAAVASLVLALAGLAWLLVAGRRGVAPTTGPVLPRSAREEALRELDGILARGWHSNGRIVDFYDATTGVLRRFAEHEDARWRSALTSTELLQGLRGRWGAGAVEGLAGAVWDAERVKFGTYRPAAEVAEADWSTVRSWIEGASED